MPAAIPTSIRRAMLRTAAAPLLTTSPRVRDAPRSLEFGAGPRFRRAGAPRGSASPPLSAIQSTALKSRIDPLGANRPEPAICPGEGVDFNLRELEAPLP